MNDRAPESNSYIAWDGRRYDGQPPRGWYLGADNRWWPSPELLADGRSADDTSTSADTPNPADRDPGGRDSTGHERPPTEGSDRSTGRPDDWAPTPNPRADSAGGPEAPLSPGPWARPRRSSTRSGSRGRWRFPRIVVIIIAFTLIRQCGSAIRSDEPTAPATPITTSTPTTSTTTLSGP